jgi:hypothetical protein
MTFELEIGSGRAILPELEDAIDNASDQGKRTWLTSGGKRIAMIVTTEDGERLGRLDGTCICPPGGDWLDSCPLHGEVHWATDGGQWPVESPITHAHGRWMSHTHQPRNGSHEGVEIDHRWD